MKTERTRQFLFLAAAALMFSGCAGAASDVKGEEATELAMAAVTEAAAKYVLPEDDWGGAEFVMMTGDEYIDRFVTEETGEALEDARYKMIRTVEEALNVKISDAAVSFWDMNKLVTQYIMSGENTYDAIAMMDRFALTAAMENAFVPIQDVETIHTEADYWGGTIASEMTVGGNQYFAVSSSDLRSFRDTSCILWNTNLGTSLELDVPWEDVFAGTWTWSDMLSYRTVANQDLNGDGLWTDADRYTYGFADTRSAASMFIQAFDMRFVMKNSEDIPYLNVTDNEALMDSLEDIHETFFTGPDNVEQMKTADNQFHNRDIFKSGNILMMVSMFGDIQGAREMQDDFAVLPMPKYNEQQENYRSRTFDAIYYSVPLTQDDVLFSGAVMDALSCVAYYDLLPVYVDTVLKDKASRDENSKRAIQICFDTRTVDFGEAFLFDYFGDVAMYDLMTAKSFTPASHFEKKNKTMTKALDKIILAFSEINS